MDCLTDALSGDSNDNDSYDSSHACYVCGDNAYTKYGSFYYCSDCLALVKAFSE